MQDIYFRKNRLYFECQGYTIISRRHAQHCLLVSQGGSDAVLGASFFFILNFLTCEVVGAIVINLQGFFLIYGVSI